MVTLTRGTLRSRHEVGASDALMSVGRGEVQLEKVSTM